MRITHLGHACLLIEAAGQRILIDPGAFVPDFAEATDLDAIVVTHQHADHLDQKRVLDIRRRNRSAFVLADPQSTAILVGLGIDTTAQNGTDHHVGPITIRPVGKKHALIHKDWPIIDNVGVVLTAPDEPSIYHPGDTLAEDPGEVDIACFPLNAPWERSREMTRFLRRLEVARAIPIHDGLLNETGRKLYLSQARTLGCATTEIVDLAGGGPVDLT